MFGRAEIWWCTESSGINGSWMWIRKRLMLSFGAEGMA